MRGLVYDWLRITGAEGTSSELLQRCQWEFLVPAVGLHWRDHPKRSRAEISKQLQTALEHTLRITTERESVQFSREQWARDMDAFLRPVIKPLYDQLSKRIPRANQELSQSISPPSERGKVARCNVWLASADHQARQVGRPVSIPYENEHSGAEVFRQWCKLHPPEILITEVSDLLDQGLRWEVNLSRSPLPCVWGEDLSVGAFVNWQPWMNVRLYSYRPSPPWPVLYPVYLCNGNGVIEPEPIGHWS